MTSGNSEIVICQTEDGRTKIDVRMDMNSVFKEGEIEPNSIVKEYLTTAADGKSYSRKRYNRPKRTKPKMANSGMEWDR